MSQEIADIYKELEADESFRDRLATVDSSGRRVWLYPKKPKGRLTNYRSIVSAILLLILFSGPFITIGGEPLLLFNILERKFVVFGQVFWPQDFHLAVIGMIASVVFIILFTVVFGRVFCGWICPQTIFMESVFRRIEHLIEGDYMKQKKLNTQSWNGDKIIKKGSKHLIFILISALIMHTFLAYLMGIDELYTLVAAGP
ncbi:MAG: 4Fe-4S binding protein, partial [Marinoscillum sp.]